MVTSLIGQPCDADGNDLPDDSPPAPDTQQPPDNYFPFGSRREFELADFLYRKEQMSAMKIDELMDIWAAFQQDDEGEPDPPFADAKNMYETIDQTELGDVPWQAFSVKFNGDIPEGAPGWMTASYEVWYRDPLVVIEGQLGNPDFNNEMDFAPKQVFSQDGNRQFTDFMLGNDTWEQAVCLPLHVYCFVS
jgi:Plavaka transposase